MHHDIQKIISYHNFYLFFPICKWKEFKLFQLLENFKKNVLMHRPSIKKSLAYIITMEICVTKEGWKSMIQIVTKLTSVKYTMLSLAAAFLIPLFSISYIISVFLVYNIISYIKQKPEANQSTFDIATLHLAWYQFICYFLNNSYAQGGPRLYWLLSSILKFICAYKFSTVNMILNNILSFER